MKTQTADFYDIKRKRAVFGIQVFYKSRWRYLAENGKPCVFDTEQERDEKRKQVRKLKTVQTTEA